MAKENNLTAAVCDAIRDAMVASTPLIEKDSANGLSFDCCATAQAEPMMQFRLFRKAGTTYVSCLFVKSVIFDEKVKEQVADILSEAERVIEKNGIEVQRAELEKARAQIDAQLAELGPAPEGATPAPSAE